MTTALQVATPEREAALLKAIGFDKLSEPQRELALAIAGRYGLDPMLKHLVMIDGRPYITRDGLLHVAHGSEQFDGMETTEPVLDQDGKFWRSTCSIFRKDMGRPFTYTGRYPVTGGNAKYAPEMAIKVAEVMALRRAFDVAAPVLEERYAGGDEVEGDEAPAPTSLAERIATRAAVVTDAPQPVEPTETAATPEADPVAVEPVADAPEVIEGIVVDPIAEVVAEPTPDPDAVALAAFSKWVKDVGITQATVKAKAKALFPDAKGFKDLTASQFADLAAALDAPVDPEFVAPVSPISPIREHDASPAHCGAVSPLSDATCTMDPGHPGVHRAGVRESWEQVVGA